MSTTDQAQIRKSLPAKDRYVLITEPRHQSMLFVRRFGDYRTTEKKASTLI